MNKVAVVTGSSRGIGSAIAERLARDGFSIVVNSRSDAGAASSVVARIEAAGGKAHAVAADVRDAEAARRLFDAAESAFGGVDVLVNNAGIMPIAPIADVDEAAFENIVGVNLRGPVFALREAAKRLRADGRIVNLSSSVVGLYQPSYGLYAATKAAIEALTHILAKELGGRGITVNAVAPGPIDTELFHAGKPQALVERIISTIPLARLGEPADVAGVVAFLVGPDGRWINGQVVRANGGVV